MNIRNNIIKTGLYLSISIGILSLSGCEKPNNDNFEPPNKTSIQTGIKNKLIKPSTALMAKKQADKMAKIWDKDAVLAFINGISIASDGFTVAGDAGSQWIFTYVSPSSQKKGLGYEIVFKGNEDVSWLETESKKVATSNIENISMDSDRVILKVEGSGLKSQGGYTLETLSKEKQILWFIGVKNGTKTEIKKIDNLTGEFVN